jgi:hypothetical protein
MNKTDKKEKIIAEIQRVAAMINVSELSRRQFSQNSQVILSTVRYAFGSWKDALKCAGLKPAPQPKQIKIADNELLQEIIRLTRELGKKPTEYELSSRGQFSVRPYKNRWKTFADACKIAYAQYGFPKIANQPNNSSHQEIESTSSINQVLVPQTIKPAETQRQKKVQFGEPIDFRGLRFAPINEQGVVYLFGMISRELGFLIESLRTDYPDCEGKRCVDQERQRWEHVRIEFEYQSSNFREHGHQADECDLIVCWIHDWSACPIEVLELKSQLKFLHNRPNGK